MSLLLFFLSLLFFLLISLIVTSFGSFFLSLFPKHFPFSQHIVLSFFLGYGFLLFFLYFLGLFSFFNITSVFFLLFFFLFVSWRYLLPLLHSLSSSLFSLKKVFAFPPHQFNHTHFLWLFLFLFFLFHALLTFFPFTEWDALAYHLPLAQHYAQTHSLAPPDFMFHAQFPQYAELLYAIGYLFGNEFGHLFVSWLLLFFHTFVFFAVFLFAKQFYGSRVALYALVISYTFPEVSIYLTDAYIDIITAGYQFIALILLFSFFFSQYSFQKNYSLLFLSFVFAGIAAGFKYTGLFSVFFTLLIALFLFYYKRHQLSFSQKKNFFLLLLFGLIFASLFFVPQYLKNYYYTGNPVWPFLVPLFPETKALTPALLDSWNDYFTNKTLDKSSLLTFFLLPFYMTFQPSSFGSIYSMGPIFFLFLPLALFFLLSKSFSFSRVQIRHILFFLFSFLFFLFIWYKTQHSYRLLFLGFFLLALVVSLTLVTLFRHFPSLRTFVLLLFFTVLFSNFLAAFVIHRSALPVLLFQEDMKYYREQRMEIAAADAFINNNLPSDAVILLSNDLRGYYLERPYVWGEPMNNMLFIDYTEISDTAEFFALLKQKGITHIRITLFPQYNYTYGFYGPYYGDHITSLYDELFANYADLLFEENHVRVYALQ